MPVALFQSQDRARGLVSAAVAVVFAVVSVEFLSSFCRVSVVYCMIKCMIKCMKMYVWAYLCRGRGG